MRLRYLTSAYHDLRLIFEYIARENPAAARRVITSIRQEAQIVPSRLKSPDGKLDQARIVAMQAVSPSAEETSEPSVEEMT